MQYNTIGATTYFSTDEYTVQALSTDLLVIILVYTYKNHRRKDIAKNPQKRQVRAVPTRQVGAVPKKTSRRDDLKKKMKEVVSLLNFRVIRKMQR